MISNSVILTSVDSGKPLPLFKLETANDVRSVA